MLFRRPRTQLTASKSLSVPVKCRIIPSKNNPKENYEFQTIQIAKQIYDQIKFPFSTFAKFDQKNFDLVSGEELFQLGKIKWPPNLRHKYSNLNDFFRKLIRHYTVSAKAMKFLLFPKWNQSARRKSLPMKIRKILFSFCYYIAMCFENRTKIRARKGKA